jgi:hypothetical protein
VQLWRRLGAICTSIEARPGGKFGWADGQGSDIAWDTVLRSPRQRVWFAQGAVRPGPLLPALAVRAVLVMNHVQGKDPAGRPVVRHQAELFLHIDSKAAALATRILGASAPHMAEQYLGQIQMFFAALAWYLDEHPDRAAAVRDLVE